MSYTITNIIKEPNGDIVYIQEDSTKRAERITKVELKGMMQRGLIEVSNYYLDSEGRLRPSFTTKGKVDHTPCIPLTEEQQHYIRQYGLVHFFNRKYLDETKKKGLVGTDGLPMKTLWESITNKPIEKCKEYNMIWFYINDEKGRTIGLNEIKNKKAKHRASTVEEMCAAVWYPSVSEVKDLRYRPEGKAKGLYPDYQAPAITTVGDISADYLEVMPVKEFLKRMSLLTENDFSYGAMQLYHIHHMMYTICQKDYDKLGYEEEKGKRFYFIGEHTYPVRNKPEDLYKDFLEDVKVSNKLGNKHPCKLYCAGWNEKIDALTIYSYYDFETRQFYVGTHYDSKFNYEKTYPTLDMLVRFIHNDEMDSNRNILVFKDVDEVRTYLHRFIDYLAR